MWGGAVEFAATLGNSDPLGTSVTDMVVAKRYQAGCLVKVVDHKHGVVVVGGAKEFVVFVDSNAMPLPAVLLLLFLCVV